MSFYLAILDDGMQDFRTAIGPFGLAENAARAEAVLWSIRPQKWGNRAPRELAEVGSFFIVSLACFDLLNCVIGPYPSKHAAKKATRELLKRGGVFEAEDDHFIAVVRYVRQKAPGRAQVAILERT